MSVKNLTVNMCQVIIGVKFLTNNKYIYGQRPHRKDIEGLQ